MNRNKIASLLASINPIDSVCISGWVRTRRDAKTFSFMEINDGSCRSNIQIIADDTLNNYEAVKKLSTGSAVTVFGVLRESPGKGQRWEIDASAIEIHGLAPESFPLQKKRHSDEFLREICHLRPRTNKFGAVFRIRSALSLAVHQFFNDQGFFYIHTPILTGSDCEGAGQLFKVTSLDMENLPKISGETDYQFDFFKKAAFLTVSGQLEAEMFALALGDVYTFGPTFRAENSNTSRHMAEFWMVEPEMAFCDLDQNMAHAESFVRYLINHALTHCADDIELFNAYVDKTLINTLNKIASGNFIRLTYTEAIDILKNSKKTFQYDIDWGSDLQTEHERYLCEDHFNGPLIIYNYPASIKPFYMRVNDDDKTVGAMDVIVPRIGEIIGGSQREERFSILSDRMAETGLNPQDYWWYLESRRYGSVPHSGYGLGFDRLIMLITGIGNIRDVIPFPRTPGNIDF